MFRSVKFCPRHFIPGTIRYESTAASPLLTKIRSDLKDAMRAKDKTRLEVLRGLISEVNNAAKTPRPIETDQGLVQLIRKRSDAIKAACEEYIQQNRNDLREQADAEIAILAQYASMMEAATAEEIKKAVSQAIEKLKGEGQKPVIGLVMKALSGEGSPLQGKYFEKAEVASIAKEALKSL
ncbi:hypothetical protein VTO42DRAFT_1351 [Malbranchea cinnamomea]